MIFWTIVFWVGVALVSEVLRPKPRFEDARPAGLGDFQFPTATEGRAVPLVWGRVKIKGPNVVWYGHLRREPITEEVKTGWFSSDEVVTGHRYLLGLQFAICRGPDVRLVKVEANERTLFTFAGGQPTGAVGLTNTSALGGEFGAGGIDGYGHFYGGEFDQPANAYLTSYSTGGFPVAYRGTCHLVFEGGWIGNSPNLQPWSFTVQRVPDGLNLFSYAPGTQLIGGEHANPMNVIYEIMTNVEWGLKIPPSEIDSLNFQQAGVTLATEGNGFSMVLDNETRASDLLDELIRQIDGVLYYDRGAGQWKVELARSGYSPSGLPVLDESNVVELTEFSRQTWEETTNQVRVRFQDASDNYKTTYAFAQDSGNHLLQGGPVAVEMQFPGVKDAALANSIAWRELRSLSYPLSKLTLKANRDAFGLRPGSLFKFSWERLGIDEVVYRVGRVNLGLLTDGKVEVFAVEDIFSTGEGVFGDPQGTGWGTPDIAAVPLASADTLVFEAPRQVVVKDPYDPNLQPRVWAGGLNPGGGTIDFRMFSKAGSSRPISDSFSEDATIAQFLRRGTLGNTVDQYATSSTRPDASNYIDVTGSLSDLEIDGAQDTVANLRTIIKINDEFIGYETAADQGGGTLRLTQLWRGLFNSSQQAHSPGDNVWFIGQSGGGLTRAVLGASDVEVDLQLRSQDVNGPVDEADCDTEQLSLTRLWRQPLPPRDPKLNGVYADQAGVDLDDQHPAGTGRTGDDARAIKVTAQPRAWRIDNVTLDHQLGLSSPPYLDDSPKLDADLTLDPEGTPVTVPTVTYTGDSPELYLLRNDVIKALGANANLPTDARLTLTPKHTPVEVGTEIAGQPLVHDMTLTSVISDDELTFGGLDVNAASAAVTFGETGTYDFDIGAALPSSGSLDANVNSGGYVTVVSSGSATGSLTVNAGDSVVLRFTQAPAADQYFSISGPTEAGHGVLNA